MKLITPRCLVNRFKVGIVVGRDRSGKWNLSVRLGRLQLWARQSPWYCPEIGDTARYVEWR